MSDFLDAALAREDAMARRVAEFNAVNPFEEEDEQPADPNPVPKLRLMSWRVPGVRVR
jgi:hypothetical protein